MNDAISLIDLVRQWLKDEMPGWKISQGWTSDSFLIAYSKIASYPVAVLSETNVKFLDDNFMLYAYDEKFFQLLSNRLFVAELGFNKALAARDKYLTDINYEK